MRKLILKLLLLIAGLLVCTNASAYDFDVDGIYYNIDGTNATVTYTNFNYNSYSGDVVIPETVTYDGKIYNVTSIGNDAFCDCSGLSSITIPNSVISIGSSAFRGSGLTSIEIPNSVTSIGGSAFYDCSVLANVYISDITAWCNIDFGNFNANPLYNGSRFYLNKKLIRDLVIPDGCCRIGNYAFYNCRSLTSVIIPNSVTNIGNDAFFDCGGLTSITIGSGVVTIGNYAFYNCSGLTSIKIPNSVTSINYYAFAGCSGLTSVTINENIKEIGVGAFVDCSSLTSVTIGENVEKIGNGTFAGCSKLSIINSLNSIPPIIYSSTFNGENGLDKSTCVLNVPVGSKAVYQLASYWNEFFNINEVDFARVEEVIVNDDLTISVDGGNIVVNGLAGDETIEVYNTAGQMVYCGTETSIPVATSGIYIVKLQNKTFKVALK